MTAAEFEARIVAWAHGRRDVAALVLAGSRARPGMAADQYADWDFHLISPIPRRFEATDWLHEIAPCWGAHGGITPRGVFKVSAVFAGAWEADFVPLATWQMRLVYAAMRRPGWAGLMPGRLRRGIVETQSFLLGSGYRILKGGPEWERRLESLRHRWTVPALAPERFEAHVAAFWPLAVWLAKRIGRAETRAANLWHGKLLLEQVYPLLAEEARLAGRAARPEARKAERWLDDERLRQTAIAPGWLPAEQARALLATVDVFAAAARSVAAARGFSPDPHAEIERWLRTELGRLAGS